MWKRGEMEKRRNCSSFPHYFIYIFLTLICRGTDISKCVSESLGIRDNEVRLYLSEKVRHGISCESPTDDSHEILSLIFSEK